MKALLAQLSLQEFLDAKVERRLALMAEVHHLQGEIASIERELAAAGVALSQLSMVREAQQEDAVARRFSAAHEVEPVDAQAVLTIAAPGRTRQSGRIIERICGCGATFECRSTTNKRKCPPCRKVAHQRNIATARSVRNANIAAKAAVTGAMADASADKVHAAARQLGYQPTADVH